MRISDWSSDVCSSDLSSSERIPELLPELRVELVEVEALVLRPRVFDLERTHQIADAADGQPVAALLDAEDQAGAKGVRSEEHTSELQSLMRISYAVFCLKKKTKTTSRPKLIKPSLIKHIR